MQAAIDNDAGLRIVMKQGMMTKQAKVTKLGMEITVETEMDAELWMKLKEPELELAMDRECQTKSSSLTLIIRSQKPNPKTDPPTFSGSVTLRKRVSKNVYDLETVRFVPHPPLEIATAIEARHFVATYALFRVSREWAAGYSAPSPEFEIRCL